ncbi:coilin-like [Iris pallida]|uniref:Coilin-like n=1 Tax=Iris pallida TaxID=29817 RepID=A0AAX6EEJ0_IRIPA|nr:coilin-like [Iris pallida]
MDDFVLPPFESTCILKDKDIIRVQKKGASLINVIEADNNQHYIQDSGIVERQPIYSNPGFLAIKEFQEDSVGRQNKNDEDSYPQNENPVLIRTLSSENTNSKRKRKHSDTTPSSKRKKSKLVRPEKSILDAEDVDDIPREQNLSCFEKGESSKKSSNKKCRTSNVDGNLLAVVDSMLDARISKLPSSVLTEERNNKPEENNACGPHVNGSSTKVQGRNARRKKERRQWLSEILSQNKDIQSEEQPNSIHKISTEEERVLNSEVQEEVVPVEIRPGHIRFESLDAGESLHQSQGAMETLQWNGITGKKQGQKWGRENTDRKWNNDNGFKEYPKSNYVAEGWNNNGKSTAEGWKRNRNCPAEGWKRNGNSSTEGWKRNGNSSAEGWKRNGNSTDGGWGKNRNSTAEGWKRNGNSTAGGWKNNGNYNAGGWKSNEKPTGGRSTGGWRSNGKSAEGWRHDGNFTAEGWRNDGNSTARGWKDKGYSTAQGWDNNGNSTAEGWKSNGVSVAEGVKNKGKSIVEEGKTGDDSIDFRSLFPLTCLPQVGDLLVYRLVELSSTWCPEVSPFRVGKVASYNPISMKIILVPVSEYPIVRRENTEGEESTDRANVSAYKEDGSLEVLYPSLVDVRLLRANNCEASSGREVSATEVTPTNNWDVALANEKAKEMANKPDSCWGQLKQVISEKKAQIQSDNGWDEWTPSKPAAGTSLRGSAMRPTPAFLRGKNGKYNYKK